MTATAPRIAAPVTEEALASLILDYAEYCGMQHFGGDTEPLELWTLRKAIPGHPKHSTVTRATLVCAIRNLHG